MARLSEFRGLLHCVACQRLPITRYIPGDRSATRNRGVQMPDAIELLKIRRSVKPREMSAPGPSPAELETILTIGARVPAHGKLTPWRFIVFEANAPLLPSQAIATLF